MWGMSCINACLRYLSVGRTEFAEALGVDPSTVSRWASGARAAPLAELRPILRGLAEARGLSWDDAWLFDGPPSDAPPADEDWAKPALTGEAA